jgi:hypothetical protein
MTMYDTREQLVSELIQGAIERLDISPELHTAAELEYQMVGDWLADHADPSGEGWRVYPQGSFRLGTVVRPEGIDEYDLDAVCLRSIRKDQTSVQLGAALVEGVHTRVAQRALEISLVNHDQRLLKHAVPLVLVLRWSHAARVPQPSERAIAWQARLLRHPRSMAGCGRIP